MTSSLDVKLSTGVVTYGIIYIPAYLLLPLMYGCVGIISPDHRGMHATGNG